MGTGGERAGDRQAITLSRALEWVERAGVRVPEHAIARTPGEAKKAAEEIGFPVVLKVISDQVLHKTDAGGIVTGIRTAEDAAAACERLLREVPVRVPGAVVDGILVQAEVPPGLELIVGGKTDPTFGKVILCGSGGILVEILRDVSIRVLPVDEGQIREMVRELRSYPLIRGFRGSPPMDEEALVHAISSLSRAFYSDDTIGEFECNPLLLSREGCVVVDARAFPAGPRPRERVSQPGQVDPGLFSPRSVAVIGASADPNKIGYVVLRNLLSFHGTVYPVNPRHGELMGRKVYGSIKDVPGPVDAAVIAIPAPAVPAVVRECGEKGVRLAIVLSSGFREEDAEGARREEEILEVARSHGMRVMGPNCLGLIVPRIGLNATFDPVMPRAGPIGFVSQSGAVITTIVDWSVPEQVGFSTIVSVGNQADLGFVEFLRVLELDPETRAVILYVEEIKRGREFMETAAEVTRRVPVIAVKSGSSRLGTRAAASHTGSLAGDYEVYQAAFRQAGIIPVHSITEAFDVAELLSSEGYPEGNRGIVVTTAGGFAVMASDYAERYGIDLVPIPEAMREELDAFLPPMWSRENPLDIIGDGGVERYARVFDVLTKYQDSWDIAVVIAVPSALLDPVHLGSEIARFSRSTRKVVIGCLLGGESMRAGERILRARHIPNYREIEAAFRAVGRALRARPR
ncbi:MAG: acetate--CoA ligase family protein [Methanolinea sp.]|nr:acetate--CoA ligase family protein [Methanolinea sp.]